jgi:drug/metabolite transporter (DMT)-like permease
MPYLGELVGLSCAAIWATCSFIWAREGKGISAFSINTFKAIAALLMVSVLSMIFLESAWPTEFTLRQQSILLISGMIGLGMGDLFYFYALLKMGARRALLMWLTAPAMAAILGMVFLGEGETIGLRGWTGMALTGIGIVVVQLERPSKDDPAEKALSRRIILWGTLAGLVASLGQAVSSLLSKFVLNEGAASLQVVQVRLAGAMVFLVLGGVVLGRLRTWLLPFKRKRLLGYALLVTFFSAVVGLFMMTLSQKLIPIGLSNTLTSTSPIFALPLAWLFFRSRVTLRAVVGTLIAFSGVALVFLE